MDEPLMTLHQLSQLRLIKLEFELMVLKNMVFNHIAKQLDGTFKDVESAHESLTHVALLGSFDSIRASLPALDEEQIRKYLGLEGQ